MGIIPNLNSIRLSNSLDGGGTQSRTRSGRSSEVPYISPRQLTRGGLQAQATEVEDRVEILRLETDKEGQR